MCVFPEKGEKKRVRVTKVERRRGREKKNKKCNHWFLAVGISYTRETVKTAGGCVCVCVCVCVCLSLSCPVCVCVRSKMCVSTHVCCCHLKRKRQADAFKPSRVQWYRDEHVKCLPLIRIHVEKRGLLILLMPCKMASNQRLFYLSSL